MRHILYAEGIHVGEGEEEIAQNEEKDELFLDRVMSDLSWGHGFYGERNREFDRQADWYFRNHYETTSPVQGDQPLNASTDDASNIENEHLVTINVPFESVQRAHTMMTGESPMIEVLVNRKSGGKVVQFLHGAIQANQRRWGANPMHDGIFNQLLYGWGVIRTTWAREPIEEDDFEGDSPPYDFPIKIESIHPEEIYPIPGGVREEWKAVVQHTQQRVYEVEEEWGVQLHMNDSEFDAFLRDNEGDTPDVNAPLDPQLMVDVIDYWAWEGDRIIHAVVAHEQFVMRPTHAKYYDMLPHTIFFCARTTVRRRGEHIGLSANYALVDSVSELERIINRQMRIIDLYAEPTTVVTRVNDEPIDVTPGGVLELVEGESAAYLQYTGTIPTIDSLERFFSRQIEEEGFGLPQQGESGLDTIAQQQAALIKIFKPVENAQEAWETVNAKIIGLIQRYSWDQPVKVRGRLDGDDESEAFDINLRGRETKAMRDTRVKLRARFPLEELRNVAAAATLKNSSLMPTEVIMKRLLNSTDPAQWREAILTERIEDDPATITTLIQNQLAILSQRAQMSVMAAEALADEASEVEARGEPSQAGTPQAPAPLGAPSEVPPDIQAQQAASQSGVPLADNATPLPVGENPAGNLGQV